jgi:hypothetical protein
MYYVYRYKYRYACIYIYIYIYIIYVEREREREQRARRLTTTFRGVHHPPRARLHPWAVTHASVVGRQGSIAAHKSPLLGGHKSTTTRPFRACKRGCHASAVAVEPYQCKTQKKLGPPFLKQAERRRGEERGHTHGTCADTHDRHTRERHTREHKGTSRHTKAHTCRSRGSMSSREGGIFHHTPRSTSQGFVSSHSHGHGAIR